jgi:hypothetical protein
VNEQVKHVCRVWYEDAGDERDFQGAAGSCGGGVEVDQMVLDRARRRMASTLFSGEMACGACHLMELAVHRCMRGRRTLMDRPLGEQANSFFHQFVIS